LKNVVVTLVRDSFTLFVSQTMSYFGRKSNDRAGIASLKLKAHQ